MNCTQCGASLPENARFCYACGSPVVTGPGPGLPPPPPPPGMGFSGGAPPPPPPPPPPAPSAPTLAPAGAESIKCPNCGAPIHAVFGEMVISCDYCGSSVTLGGAGWKQINKHTLLTAKVTDREAALRIVHDFLDTGFLHRKAFEESKIVEERLSFVPFWIVPVSATTNYVYQDVAVGVGGTVATIAGAELLGNALGGNRGGGFFPVVTGPPVNPTRSDTIVGMFEFPVVAVKGMSAYQPKNYQFGLADRSFFDKKGIPDGSAVLNGDLGEDAAQHAARSYVTQLQSDQAHKKHHMVSRIQTVAEVSEAELLHVPIFYFSLDRRGQRSTILVDAHAGQVMPTIAP
jgi:hypothetical protein